MQMVSYLHRKLSMSKRIVTSLYMLKFIDASPAKLYRYSNYLLLFERNFA